MKIAKSHYLRGKARNYKPINSRFLASKFILCNLETLKVRHISGNRLVTEVVQFTKVYRTGNQAIWRPLNVRLNFTYKRYGKNYLNLDQAMRVFTYMQKIINNNRYVSLKKLDKIVAKLNKDLNK